MPWPSKIAINFGGGAGAGDGDNIYSAFQQVETKFNAIVDTGIASSSTTAAGADTTQPVHSAGVAAAIAARLGDGVVSYRSVVKRRPRRRPPRRKPS